MGSKPLSPLIIVAIIAAAVLLFGIIGWKFANSGSRDANGADLSKPSGPAPGAGGPPTTGK